MPDYVYGETHLRWNLEVAISTTNMHMFEYRGMRDKLKEELLKLCKAKTHPDNITVRVDYDPEAIFIQLPHVGRFVTVEEIEEVVNRVSDMF